MKTNNSLSAVASVAKGKRIGMGILLLAVVALTGMTQGSDIFTSPTPNNSIPYKTSAALLAATRSGDALLEWPYQGPHQASLERSLKYIVQSECGINFRNVSANCAGAAVLLFSNITKYETSGTESQERKWAANSFQSNRKVVAGEISPKSLEALDAFIKAYSKAIKDYVIEKQDQTEQKQAAAEKEKQQADAIDKQAQIEREQKKALVEEQKANENARMASLAAEEATKAEAIKEARAAQKEDRALKLKECLESPAYKLWQASLKVATGLKMIQNAQSLLDHDNAVARESDVSNLAERRRAGEDIVAGKLLVEKAFASYKQLGGTASKPEEVVPGPDPAAQYR